jgi:glucose/arabinose dehydrogenase
VLAGTVVAGPATLSAAPFSITGPGIDPAEFRITTFAEGLNFPVGMAELDDGSLLVATSNGNGLFGSSTGSLIRLADVDGDGVADERQTLVDDVPGGRLTSVRRAGSLVFVTGQGTPLTIYRTGELPTDSFTEMGRIEWDYPSGGWLHPHSALQVALSDEEPGRVHLFVQLGSRENFASTSETVSIAGTPGLGLNGQLAGESLYRLDLFDDGTAVVAAGPPVRVATGLRNAAGFAFDPVTSDLYLEDNGIDGPIDPNEPRSADELNRLAREEALGYGAPVDFGFPHSYVEYRSGNIVRGLGRAPEVAFQPLPPPNGRESEGPNDIVFAPPTFPEPLRDGLFIGFHGRFGTGGTANEENPLVFVDVENGTYFHFIETTEPEVGHLDGLLSTGEALFIADLSPTGGLGNSAVNTGRIYQIQHAAVVPEPASFLLAAAALLGIYAGSWRRTRR